MPKARYIVLSKHKPGSFGWAMDQLEGGNRMRRPHWPYRRYPGDEIYPLFIWRVPGDRMMLGYSTAIIGDDGANPIEGLGTPSMYYTPSEEDKHATDWKNADVFFDEDVMIADATKWRLLPSSEDLWRQEEAARRELKRRHGRLFVAAIVLLVLAVYTVAGVIGGLR